MPLSTAFTRRLVAYTDACSASITLCFQVMVTAGGNQAFAMVALSLLDPGDRVLLVRLTRPEVYSDSL